MNFILIVIGAFLGCLLENLMLGAIQYFLKTWLVKKRKVGVYDKQKKQK